MLLLTVRGGGFRSDGSTPSAGGWHVAAQTVPGVWSAQHTLYVAGGFRGNLELEWSDPSTDDSSLDATDFPDHTVVMHFEPI
jgi:hypothetical protein